VAPFQNAAVNTLGYNKADYRGHRFHEKPIDLDTSNWNALSLTRWRKMRGFAA